MIVGNYAASKPYVCLICKGKGCSYCDNRGLKVRNLQLISEEPMDQRHIHVQKHLKDVEGTIVVEEEEEIKALEEKPNE